MVFVFQAEPLLPNGRTSLAPPLSPLSISAFPLPQMFQQGKLQPFFFPKWFFCNCSLTTDYFYFSVPILQSDSYSQVLAYRLQTGPGVC